MAAALSVAISPAAAAPKVCASCVQANMARLAAPEMRGRACGTEDENAAARYVADQLKASHIKGAGEGGGYLQPVQFRRPSYAAPPVLEVGAQRFVQGQGIVTLDPAASVSGPLVRVGLADTSAAAGKVALYDAPYDPRAVATFYAAGA